MVSVSLLVGKHGMVQISVQSGDLQASKHAEYQLVEGRWTPGSLSRYSRQDNVVSVLLRSTAVISWVKGVSAFGHTVTARAGGVLSLILQLKAKNENRRYSCFQDYILDFGCV